MRIGFIIFLTLFTLQLNAEPRLSDNKATKETKCLFRTLSKSTKKGYFVGHQDALAYGVNWKYILGRSDVRDVVGDDPGLYGWEIGHIENSAVSNLDSVPFDKMKLYIREGYSKGGIITISWHGDNPLTGKSAWDAANGTVASVLPGGVKHKLFIEQLDRVAAFLGDLKGNKGEVIPILFRPFHELTGHWFWWGAKSCTAAEYKQLFRFTIDYLRRDKKLHNLIVVYNTGTEIKSNSDFLERYPGDDYVDIFSFDTYQHSSLPKDNSFVTNLRQCLSIVTEVAKQKGKLAAVAEIGFNQIPYQHWFTEVLQPVLKEYRIAYTLFWRNAGYKPQDQTIEYYVPYKGHAAAGDFLKFYRAPETLFLREARKMNPYN
jgi:mannan endo-1,4-beta-mannosidase